jgi:hypothetical protein
MVERFNRRRGERLGRMPQNRAAHHRRFRDHAERDADLNTFVADDNRTRLRCLDDQAPTELLAKLAGPNTFAGAGLYGALAVKGVAAIHTLIQGSDDAACPGSAQEGPARCAATATSLAARRAGGRCVPTWTSSW